jgi:peptidoglycan/LPS O-acetylase OafA/YrhL
MQPAELPRLHSLDALRASMMLLGLVLHSAVSYITTPLGPAWPYKDPNTSIVFDLLVFSIHLFRMPAFFVVAGFFAAVLYQRDGTAGFLSNRVRRVLLPLVIFWGVMMPLCGYGFVFSARQVGGPMPWEYLTDQPMVRQPILGHLWFLYYLMLFYVAALLVVPLAGRVPSAVRARIDRMFRAIVTEWWGPLAAGIITALTLIPMTAPGLDTEPALLPPLRVLVAYGVFFGFGWWLFHHHKLLESFGSRYIPAMIAGAITTAAYAVIVLQPARFDDLRVWHLTAVGLAGIATWLLIFGLLGLFVRRLSAPRPLVRYLSDASYWMYLTHLAPAAWLPGVFAHLDLPAAIKFLLVFGITMLVTLVTYHYLVRTTAIGELLNGRRYPRAARPAVAGPFPA